MYRVRKKLGLILSLVVMISAMFSVSVFAVSEEQAMQNLTTYVYSKIMVKEYTLEGGGSVTGADLFDGKPTEGYDLLESEYSKLSSKAQSELVSDIAMYSNEAIDNTKAPGVEEDTVQEWWKQLQTKEGVGSRFMSEILKNTKPDFVSANKIYEPFSTPVSIFLGLGAILIASFLGVVMVADIAYITLPPVRLFVDNNDGGSTSKRKASFFFSHSALQAVREAESGDSSSGTNKQALGIYFKSRVVMLIILGICLLYLVQGQIYTLVGYILDLVSGFIGF